MANTHMSLTAVAATQAMPPDPFSMAHAPGNRFVLATVVGLVTLPVWRTWLDGVSETAASIAPILGLLIGLATLYNALRGRDEDKARGETAKTITEALSNAGAVARRGGLWAATFAAAFAIGSLLLYMLSPRKDAAAAPVASATRVLGKRKSADAAGDDGEADGFDDMPSGAPPWFAHLWRLRGLHEGTKRKPNPTVLRMFAASGHPEVRDTTAVAWCSAGLCDAMQETGQPNPRTLGARDWLKWGTALDAPRLGCVVVFWRVSPRSWQGHVGLYAGEDATHIHVLGCNQSDSVTVARFAKSRVLGYRWPAAPKPLTQSTIASGATASGGAAAAAGAAALGTAATHTPAPSPPVPDVSPVDQTSIDALASGFRDMAPMLPWAGAVAGAIGVAAAAYVVWRRYKHRQATGT